MNKPKIIIMVTIDCLRFDYIKRLLKAIPRGWGKIVLHKHHANAPYTLASFPSIFTSTPLFMMGGWKLKGRMSFVEVLSSRGYLTIGINGGNPYLSSKEYSRLFSKYVGLSEGNVDGDQRDIRKGLVANTMKVGKALVNSTKRLSNRINLILDSFLERIYFSVGNIMYRARYPLFDAFLVVFYSIKSLISAVSENKKVFLWIHFMDLHYPYTSYVRVKKGLLHTSRLIWDYIKYETLGSLSLNISVYKEMYESAFNYLLIFLKALLEYIDEVFSDYEVYVVITSDHGEEFGEHGSFGHEGLRFNGLRIPHLYEENIHVPFIIASPNIDYNLDVTELTSHLDIAPTLVAMEDRNLSFYFRQTFFLGRNLFEIVDNKGDNDSYVVSESAALITHGSINYGEAFALVKCFDKHCFKYIWNPILGEELYDLEKDPYERINLIDVIPELAKEFRRMLHQHLKFRKKFQLKYKINLALLKRRGLR